MPAAMPITTNFQSMSSEEKLIPDGVPKKDRERSAFGIWLHPCRARRELEALRQERADLADLLERTGRERTRLFDEAATLRSELAETEARERRESDSSRRKTERLEVELSNLRLEIEEWRETRKELEAISQKMQEWEEVKAHYEDRIKRLTLRLRDALGHKRLGGADATDSSDILEEGESPYVDRKNGADAPLGGLLPDETPAPLDMTRRDAPVPRPKRRLPKDDTDWLMSLPEE